MKTSSLFKIVVCLITVLMASCVPQSPDSTEIPPPIEITSFPSTLKMNNINIEFSGYEVDDQTLTIVICFDPPSEETWFFDDITLKVENQEFSDNGVSRSQETGRADGFECETIIYYLSDSITPIGKAELSIGRLGAYIDSDEQNCDNAQKNLDEAKTGIVITCDPTIVGHDSGFVILEKPNFMSDEEAFLVVLDAFSYSDAILLNWRFSFLIEKP